MPKPTLIHQPSAISDLDAEETVVLYPTYGYRLPGSPHWRVTISGAVYQPEHLSFKSRILLRLLRRVLGKTGEEIQSQVFQDRVRHFSAATEKGKRIAFRLGDRVFRLRKKSRRNGHFSANFRLTEEQIERWQADGHIQDGWLGFSVVVPDGDDRSFQGRCQLIGPYGTSIISDIDDTVKHTGVTNRREMLANTFMRPFSPIDGMAALYREWADQETPIHYVSSSPWQLFSPLESFRDEHGFPAGSFHLRSFRLRDHMLRRLLLIRRKGKGTVIGSIVKRFPGREFILVGDSGERDPEIYGALARRYPDRVKSILIRQLADRPLHSARHAKVFRRLDHIDCRTFESAEQVPEEALVGA